MNYPNTIGGCLKLLAANLRKQDALTAKLQPLADEEKKLREHMITSFKKTELRGANGSGLSTTILETPVPVLKDWKKFLAFCKRKGNDDLLKSSVATKAWRERIDAGKKVPGVEVFNAVSLRVTQVKAKDKKGGAA